MDADRASVDQGWGVMHLVQNSYVDTLGEAAALLGMTPQVLKDDARENIRAAAALLAHYAGESRSEFTTVEDWFGAVKRFSALDGDELQTMQAERYFEVVRNGVDKPTLWNERVQLNAHPNVSLDIPQQTGNPSVGSVDYSPAKSNLYSDCTYTPGRSHAIDTWVNHWIGYGTYAGAISYLSRCDVRASAHFVIRQDGEITQTVRVKDTAWHAGASGYPNNSRSIGIEHEAVVTDPTSWDHPEMLKASAEMARYFADKYGIPKKRALPGIRGHNEMPGTNTQCPGWMPWDTWMSYFNGESDPDITVSGRINDEFRGGGWETGATLRNDKDIVGLASFEVEWMDINITGDLMKVDIRTDYVDGTVDTTYGDLFISSDGWHPYGDAPYYYDNYNEGEVWEYVFDVDQGNLYDIRNAQDQILFSDTAYAAAHNREYYRAGQEALIDPAHLTAIGTGSAGKNGDFYSLSFDISGMGLDLLNLNLGFHWGQTCGNDVIEGVFQSVPEPSTVLLLGAGLAGLIAIGRKRFLS